MSTATSDTTARVLRLFLTIGLAFALSAAAQSVDPNFAPVPSKWLDNASPLKQLVQPDGKIIVYGIKAVVDGVAKGDIFRLNDDGTLDTSFSYCSCGLTTISSIKLAPGGKMIVAGSIPGFGKMIRLNADGSIDPGFEALIQGPVPTFMGSAEFFVSAVQPDGKVLALRRFSSTGNDFFHFRRYNDDGSIDNGFTEIPLISGSPASASVVVELLADGRFFMAYSGGTSASQTGSVTLRTSTGAIDASWAASSFAAGGFHVVVNLHAIWPEADGSVLVAGRWNTVNGLARNNLVRLLPGGNVDLNFTSPSGQWGRNVSRLPDGKILYTINNATFAHLDPNYRIFRLNSDSSPDHTFSVDPALQSILNQYVLDSGGRILVLAETATVIPRLARLLPTGVLDSSFVPNITVYASIYASAVSSNGKAILAGDFVQMNGVSRRGIARINVDGSLDTTFNPGTGFRGSGPAEKLLIQVDGKILALGGFVSYNDETAERLVRINPDGTRDASFTYDPASGTTTAVALAADRKILVGGTFASVNGIPRKGIARLFPDGTVDGFNPILGVSPQVRDILVQPDGMIMIGGLFATVNGFTRANLARVGPDGLLDQSFNANLTSSVSGILQQASDGKYVITTGNQTGLSRRNTDGSLDGTFTPPTFTSPEGGLVSSVLLQQDGSMIVAGRFETLFHQLGTFSRRHITRLLNNGTVDLSFMPDGTDARIRSMSRYSSSRIIIGGDFANVLNVGRIGNARLTLSAVPASTLFDFNGDGRADITVFRPSTGVWYELYSGGTVYGSPTFGSAGDIPTPADFDGDGVTDEAIFHPSTGEWWYSSSLSNEYASIPFGQSGDVPRPFDYDGDGRADFVVYRPSDQTWYRFSTFTGYAPAFHFGSPGDIPVTGDFDGDGKGDIAVFRPSTGVWWYAASSQPGSFRATPWGQSGDIPVPADFDGDGKTDVAVFRPSNGVWYVLKSGDLSYISVAFGTGSDRPVAADYDGDGKSDIAVYRPSEGAWYLLQSTAGFSALQWGIATDAAIPNVYLP